MASGPYPGRELPKVRAEGELRQGLVTMSKPLSLDSAIQVAASTLPTGYVLRVVVERGAGWLELTAPNGDELEIPGEPKDPLGDLVSAAVLHAQQHAGPQSTTNRHTCEKRNRMNKPCGAPAKWFESNWGNQLPFL